MKKALLPLLIASILPATAFADVVVYGKANVAWQYTDKNGTDATYTEVVNHASRIGLKGGEAINDDLKAIYQFEYEAKPDDGNGPFSQRNIYVGLKGSAGTATIGMFDTPLKLAQEKVDVFNDTIGDLKYVIEGEVRAKNIVQYSSPAFSNVTVNVALVNAEQDVTNAKDGYSASVVYDTKQLYLALAADSNSLIASNKSATPPAADTEIMRAVARVVTGPVVLGAMYETYDNGTVDEDGFLGSVLWKLNSDWALKAQYIQSDMIHNGNTSASIGADYKLSKATKVYGYATKIDDDRAAVASRADDTYIGVGMELNF